MSITCSIPIYDDTPSYCMIFGLDPYHKYYRTPRDLFMQHAPKELFEMTKEELKIKGIEFEEDMNDVVFRGLPVHKIEKPLDTLEPHEMTQTQIENIHYRRNNLVARNIKLCNDIESIETMQEELITRLNRSKDDKKRLEMEIRRNINKIAIYDNANPPSQ